MSRDSNGSTAGLLADVAARRKHHQRMAFVAFWLHEVFFYSALASSCVAAVMALAKNSGLAFKVISGLPPLLLLVIGTAPFSARAVWHRQFADALDALSREVQHEGKLEKDASAELTELTNAMRRRYPQARWNTGAGSPPSKAEERM